MRVFDTVCKSCVFSLWDGITQTGCYFDRVEKYRRQGKEIVEAYDDEKEFYIIKDTVCTTSRTERWVEAQEEKDIVQLAAAAWQEITIDYHWILVDDGRSSLTEIKEQIARCKDQTIKPSMIHVVRYPNSQCLSHEIRAALNKSKIRWSIEDVADTECILDFHIDSFVRKFPSQYYFLTHTDIVFPANFAEEVNNIVNVELTNFGILKRGGISVVPTNVHKHLQGGAFQIPLQDKLEAKCPEAIISRE